jgi:uncharacterized protein
LASVKQLKLLTDTATPLDPSTRIDAIDVLRGIALFGVLAVNLVTEFRVSIFQQFLPELAQGTSADRAVQSFVSLALESKAFSLFSLLFGLGLVIQFERLARSGSPLRWLVRRLAVLLVIGLIHLILIWNGDILTEYALAGFVVLPILFAPRWALLAGCAAFLLLYLILPSLALPVSWPTPAWMQQHVNEANAVYATGNAADVLRFSIREIRALLPLHIYVFPRTVALFLLGVFIWRTGLFKETSKKVAILFPAASVCLIVGWLLTSTAPNVLSPLAPVFLALGYAASVIWLMTFATVGRWLEPVGALGRMAFTNYLLQSVVFGWIFFGYGLGLFGKLGAASTMAIGAVVYGIQVLLSSWWLRRFRFGPVEWLWRTLMYGTRQPMARVPVQ